VTHLYVHVPFCVRRCSYCDFSIAVRKHVPGSEYVHVLLRELDLLRNSPGGVNPGAMPRGPEATGAQAAQPRGPEASGTHPAQPRGPKATELETLYLGGGTPSLLPATELARLITTLLDAFHSTPSLDAVEVTLDAVEVTLDPVEVTLDAVEVTLDAVEVTLDAVEVTLEANPEDVTPENATTWRAAGVNRVSLGAQSFDDRVLQWMHRSHDAARIASAVHTLRGAGIDNISLDLIFALPGELRRDWGRDLDHALALRPTHLSLYGLTVEPRTPLDRWISRGATRPPDEDRYAEEYLLAHRRLTADGYQFYEVSNASLDGFRSRHNSAYWSGRPYLGLGPAAHSFDGRTRRWNLSAWEAYARAIADGRSPVESEETLTPEQQELERIYLALRTSDGLDTAHCRPLPPVAAQWAERGWVEQAASRLRCTPEGWLRLDGIVAKLFSTKELSQS
jgi:oxygen-independent coproporphyrinogen-3 oxidase